MSNASNLVSGDDSSGVFVRVLGPSSLTVPSGLAVAPISASSLRLTWQDQSSGETGFAIERLEHGVFQVIGTTAANAGQFLDSGLLPASTYSYRVRACDVSGFSPYSGTASGVTLPLAPSAPTGFTAAAASQTAVQLSWTDASDNAQGFTLERAVGSGGSRH